MSGPNKIHEIREWPKWPTLEISSTWCGIQGTQDKHCTSEFITMDGRDARYEVVIREGEQVTCLKCIRNKQAQTLTARAKP